ncbi:MAG TPA: hypothetical protein VF062_09075 [Candidatus Limnocylindrales bacterium]
MSPLRIDHILDTLAIRARVALCGEAMPLQDAAGPAQPCPACVRVRRERRDLAPCVARAVSAKP